MEISTNPYNQANMIFNACSNGDHHQQQQQQQQQQEKKPRPQQEQALKCPRCDSINTKFCYYNNYSLSQPRYFCKGCRRYWTQGGSLRNVPVGGGCRKNKRSSSSSSSSSTSSSSSSSPSSSNSSSKMRNNMPVPLLLPPPPTQPPSSHYDSFLLSNPNPSHGFLDILNGGGNGNANGYFGNVQEMENMVLPFEGGFMGSDHYNKSCKGFDGEENNNNNNNNNNKVLMGLPWQLGSGDVSMGLDYGSWHGLINSSLM
ncbi:hypothetical protein J5N97_002280 [Dioscorea zingiberensis]|uniref:Dof zinc finger protein n=1 Tax=Dioscorea zingiberensis TaxID=325984 RepID=A0A9D5D3F2_9LILI|nr:hypothetical protein J5N97_002280 [Dioscorea zingiberensis]